MQWLDASASSLPVGRPPVKGKEGRTGSQLPSARRIHMCTRSEPAVAAVVLSTAQDSCAACDHTSSTTSTKQLHGHSPLWSPLSLSLRAPRYVRRLSRLSTVRSQPLAELPPLPPLLPPLLPSPQPRVPPPTEGAAEGAAILRGEWIVCCMRSFLAASARPR